MNISSENPDHKEWNEPINDILWEIGVAEREDYEKDSKDSHKTLSTLRDKMRTLIHSIAQQEYERGRNDAVDYLNKNLMWGRSSDKKRLEIHPEHIEEVLEAARLPQQLKSV